MGVIAGASVGGIVSIGLLALAAAWLWFYLARRRAPPPDSEKGAWCLVNYPCPGQRLSSLPAAGSTAACRNYILFAGLQHVPALVHVR